MAQLRFPSSLDQLTPEIVTALLAEQHPGVRVTNVSVLESANRGDGVASTADRVALELEYETDAGLPSRVMLKTVFLHRSLRFGPSAIQLTGKVFDVLGALPFGSRLRPWVFSAIGAYQRYRQAPIWGLVIGWLITPTENYGEAIAAANLSRLVAAVQDLETLKALG